MTDTTPLTPDQLAALREQVADLLTPLADNARMQAYYYGFDRTGVGVIDAILSAIAVAGKASHHTDAWADDDSAGYYLGHPGLVSGEDSAVGLIEANAKHAAALIVALVNAVPALLDMAEQGQRAVAAIEHEAMAREDAERQASLADYAAAGYDSPVTEWESNFWEAGFRRGVKAALAALNGDPR